MRRSCVVGVFQLKPGTGCYRMYVRYAVDRRRCGVAAAIVYAAAAAAQVVQRVQCRFCMLRLLQFLSLLKDFIVSAT